MGKSKILIVYTGGTIGSFIDPETDSLKPERRAGQRWGRRREDKIAWKV